MVRLVIIILLPEMLLASSIEISKITIREEIMNEYSRYCLDCHGGEMNSVDDF